MKRIKTYADARTLKNLIVEKLSEYEIKFASDVLSITSDGAAVMKLLAKDYGKIHITYVCHGIHLAVIDMLNKSFDDFTQPIESPLLEEVNNIKDENGSEGQQEYMGFNEESLSEDEEESIEEYGMYFDDIMKKVRKIIKSFKYSPKMMDISRFIFLLENA